MSDPARANSPRKRPRQERSRHTVECIVEGAARIFRREGMGATTNRIAVEAGVSVGTLYEYFPNKEALLVAIAERHVALAERGIDAALARAGEGDRALLAALSRAIGDSHRYPSEAVRLVAGVPEIGASLRERAAALRARVLRAIEERIAARGLSEPALRARVVFGVIGELRSQLSYETESAAEHEVFASHLLAMAMAYLDEA